MTAVPRKRKRKTSDLQDPEGSLRGYVFIDRRDERRADAKPRYKTVVVRPNVITVTLRAADGKRRYTSVLRRPQIMERRLTRGAQRAVSAMSSGLDTWVAARNKSARKRRDGALVDLPRNATKAWAKFVRKSTRVPLAVVRNFRGVRAIPLPPFVFFR